MQIIAHRGSSFLAPENTLAAFELAWRERADGIEGDFRLTADGHIVAAHDADMRRTAGVDWLVAERTLAELQTLDVGRWKGPQWAGERMPTLDDVVATAPNGKSLFVEIKCGVEIIPALHSLSLRERAGVRANRLILISLNLNTITAIKRASPELPAYWVVDFRRDEAGEAASGWTPDPNEALSAAVAAGLDGLDLRADGPLDAAYVSAIHAAELRTCVWTVDSPAHARRLRDIGIQAVTTNRPGWLREQLKP
jgi:glycerophosphoryl diester phosphodiesterase